VRDNKGPGLWSDVDSTGVTYEENNVIDNELSGIVYEISEQATISHNKVRGNGFGFHVWLWGAGILISASHNILISDNTVTDNANSINRAAESANATACHASYTTSPSNATPRPWARARPAWSRTNGDEAIFEPASMISFTDNT
jgi:parallel beta-helix repeat protein